MIRRVMKGKRQKNNVERFIGKGKANAVVDEKRDRGIRIIAHINAGHPCLKPILNCPSEATVARPNIKDGVPFMDIRADVLDPPFFFLGIQVDIDGPYSFRRKKEQDNEGNQRNEKIQKNKQKRADGVKYPCSPFPVGTLLH